MKWIETHFGGMRYGLIMDPLLMLERIYGDDEGDMTSIMKSMESRLKLKIETGAEASALNSLRHVRPRIFHKGRPMMVNVPNKSRLNMMAAFTDWKSNEEGVSNFIMNKMIVLHASLLTTDINVAFGGDPATAKAHKVALLCLTNTVTFLTQLMGLVNSIYKPSYWVVTVLARKGQMCTPIQRPRPQDLFASYSP